LLHEIQTHKTMKAQTNLRLIILSFLFLLLSFSYSAAADGFPRIPKYDALSFLAPVTPSEAIFEEENGDYSSPEVYRVLAPVTPAEAGFENETYELVESSPVNLSPVTPAEANFEETYGVSLVPAAPHEASFEEI
jgi:hypothetical protein